MKWFLRPGCLLALAFLLCTVGSSAQTNTYRVFFRDKGPESFAPGSGVYQQTMALFTERALERRSKVRPEGSLIDSADAPVYIPYLQAVEDLGGDVRLTLRWENYAVVEADSADAAAIALLPFVRGVAPTSSRMSILAHPSASGSTSIMDSPVFAVQSAGTGCGDFRYGPSYEQAESINVPPLHELGITGHGVLIGFLDSGFRWRTHPALNDAMVVGEYDVIFGDSVTANQEPDIPSQDDHGTLVFSTVGGFLQDSLIGIAPNAAFLLGKTEDIRSEKHIEEDNYAAGVEWMETRGADIITSSLGYYDFDTDQEDYLYEQLNGRTTVVARAVNRAVEVGVVCLTAAGNEGTRSSTGTIISPGDADSVITVAAARRNEATVTSFSSRGPRGDGARKPDIAAQGSQVYCAHANIPPVIKTSDGTSLATPLVAGGTALLLSVFPELTPWEVRDLLYSTASQANNPDTALGYGVADIFQAISKRGVAITPELAVYRSSYRSPEQCRVVAKMLSSTMSLSGELHVRFADEASFRSFPLQASSIPYTYYVDIPIDEFHGQPAQVYVTATNGLQSRRMPFRSDSLITIHPDIASIPCGVAPAKLPLDFSGNIIEGVHPSVVRKQETGAITVALSTQEQSELVLQVYDVLGRRVLERVVQHVPTGMTTVTVPISSLATGTYFVQVLYNGSVSSHPFSVLP